MTIPKDPSGGLGLRRAQSLYTFGSLVRASTYLTGEPISGRYGTITGYPFQFTSGALTNSIHVKTGGTYDVQMRRIEGLINRTGEPGVDFHADHPAYSDPMPITALYDPISRKLWLTAIAYGPWEGLPVDPANTGLTVENPVLWGERGMMENDNVKIGTHNYRFVLAEDIEQQEDRLLLSDDPGLGDEGNVLVMRDRLIAAIRADNPENAGVIYGLNQQPHFGIHAQPEGDDAIRIMARAPGYCGNETEVKDSGDGAFSEGSQLSGGYGDFNFFWNVFAGANQLNAEVLQAFEALKRELRAFGEDV